MNTQLAAVLSSPSKRDRAALDGLLAELKKVLGERCVTSAAVREQHAHTLTWIANQPPDAVVFPLSTDEVSAIVKLCAEARIPIIPFGAGTSLEGHVNAPHGGICLDMSRMKRIVAVNDEDLNVVVEAGVTRKELNSHLRDMGLFFPIDPGADACGQPRGCSVAQSLQAFMLHVSPVERPLVVLLEHHGAGQARDRGTEFDCRTSRMTPRAQRHGLARRSLAELPQPF